MYNRYIEVCDLIKTLQDEKLQLEADMYTKHADKMSEKETGTINVEDEGFKLTVIKKESVSVDQEMASVVGIGFKIKYEFSKTEYNKLSSDDKKRVDECLTTKPAKPSFTLVKIEG